MDFLKKIRPVSAGALLGKLRFMQSHRHTDVESEIRRALQACRFAVLATQDGGQPHTSLMAITPLNGISQLLFATYRATLKYRNLTKDGRVALLIDGRKRTGSGSGREIVLTAHGIATELSHDEFSSAGEAHLMRHPDLKDFLASPDCALLTVAVSAWEVVAGTEDVVWHTAK